MKSAVATKVTVQPPVWPYPPPVWPYPPPVFQFPVGHVICSTCYGKLSEKVKCEACHKTVGDVPASKAVLPEPSKKKVDDSKSKAVQPPKHVHEGCVSKKKVNDSKSSDRDKKSSTGDKKSSKDSIVKMGPCGGDGGNAWKMDMRDVKRIVKVVVFHGGAVDAMSVVYERDGKEEKTKLWGGTSGIRSKICLCQDEYLKTVKGHYGTVKESSVIRSLTFVSNHDTYGPFGREKGEPFELPAVGGKILGFHGRSGGLLVSLGTYVKMGKISTGDKKSSKDSIVKMGPCGGDGGIAWTMDMRDVERIVKLIVFHGRAVDAMSVVYERDGKEEKTKLWGGTSGIRAEICLRQDEYLKTVKGHYGTVNKSSVIRSLTFVSNRDTYGPLGKEKGEPFELPAVGGKIMGFHGRSGGLLVSLGTYVKMGKMG